MRKSLFLGLLVSVWMALFGAFPARPNPPQPVLPLLPSFSASKRVAPAVVNISSTIKVGKGGEAVSPFQEGDPFHEFFEKSFGQMPERQMPRRSLGSGFIIDPPAIS